jgi:hypothetical protein
MKVNIPFLFILLLIYSCTTEKIIGIAPPPMTVSRSLEAQHELAVMMKSWTPEQIDEFRRNYVYSKVELVSKNGDTLVLK